MDTFELISQLHHTAVVDFDTVFQNNSSNNYDNPEV